jgi:hypothetical protein
MAVAAVALSSNRLTSSTVARCCYQMVTLATGEDVMSPEPVATDSHNNNAGFGDITDESL